MATPSSEFDAIVKWAGDNDKQIIQQVLNGLEFIQDVRIIRNVSSHGMLLPKMTASKGIRPLDLSITEAIKPNRNFSGRKLFVYPGMKIIQMVSEEFRKTFADRGLDPKAKQIPFAQFVWQGEMAKLASEINDNTYQSIYHGDATDFDAAVVYHSGDYVVFGSDRLIYRCNATTTAGQSPLTTSSKWDDVTGLVLCNGWGTIIASEITASNISPITTGAITSTNALAKIELMYNDMPVRFRRLGGVVRVGYNVWDAYVQNERAVYPYQATPALGDTKKYVYGSQNKWEIRPCTWMGASNRVIMTQENNLVFGTFMEDDANQIANIIPTLHGYDAIVKWLMGCEIADTEAIFVNDQA